MRSLTSDMQAAIIAGTVSPFYLVALQFNSGTKRMWTGIGTIVSGGHEWEGQGDFIGSQCHHPDG